MHIIDAHCHVYPESIALKAAHATGDFYDGLPTTCDGTVCGLLEEGKSCGIDHFIVQSVATSPKQVRSINRFIAREVEKHPGVLTGLGTLHPDGDIEGDFACLVELGLKGVKLHPDIQRFRLDDARCRKIYELCEERGLPMLLHTGDKRYDNSNPNRLLPVLERYKNLTVIGAHFAGWSIWEESTEKLHGIENLYVDCSSAMYALDDETTVRLIRTWGADRVLFGSDFPMWSPAAELRRFMALGLTDGEREMILHENAERLFGIRRDKQKQTQNNTDSC